MFIPEKFKTKMIYQKILSFDIDDSAVSNTVVRINNPFDILEASGNEQPMGFDQLITLYDQFLCTSGTLEIHFNSAESVDPLVLVLYPTTSSLNVTTSREQAMEQPKRIKRICGAQGSSNDFVKLSKHSQTKVVAGENINVPDYHGTAVTSPAKLVYWVLFVSNMAGNNSVHGIASIKISQWITWSKTEFLESS